MAPKKSASNTRSKKVLRESLDKAIAEARKYAKAQQASARRAIAKQAKVTAAKTRLKTLPSLPSSAGIVAKSIDKDVTKSTKNLTRSVDAIKKLLKTGGKNAKQKRAAYLEQESESQSTTFEKPVKVKGPSKRRSYTLKQLPLPDKYDTLSEYIEEIDENWEELDKLKKEDEFWGFKYYNSNSLQVFGNIDLAMKKISAYEHSQMYGTEKGPNGKKLVDGIRIVKFEGTDRAYQKARRKETAERIARNKQKKRDYAEALAKQRRENKKLRLENERLRKARDKDAAKRLKQARERRRK